MFVKFVVANLLAKYGKGMTSFRFTRKGAVEGRSEKSREMFKEVAAKLLADKKNDLVEIEI